MFIHCCVLNTAFDAQDLDYRVVTLGDATAGLDVSPCSNDETFDVEEGDGIRFRALRNHPIRNEGAATARALWTNLRRRA